MSRRAIAIALLLSIGAALRTYQYFSFDSLWSDELAIALNVVHKGWAELLTEPLDHNQVASIGFLAAEKVGVTMLGASEAGLRLFPYLASIAALFLFWRVSTRYLHGWPRVAALALFAFDPMLLWYTRNAKQYSGDVAVVLTLLLVSLRMDEGRHEMKAGSILGLLGGLAILLSQPAALLAPALVAVLLVQRWRAGRRPAPVVALGAGWLTGAAILTASSMMVSSKARGVMVSAWDFAFFPATWESWSSLLWLPERALVYFGFLIGSFKPDTAPEIALAGIYLALAVVGSIDLARHHPRAAAFLLVPPVIAILASIARILPLSGRVAIYMAPSLLVLSMAGVARIQRSLPRGRRRIADYAVLFLGLVPAMILPLRLPSLNDRQPARPVLEELRSRWRDGDVLFVEKGARMAMGFYGEPLGLELWVTGKRPDRNAGGYPAELDALRGQSRVWVFFVNTPLWAARDIRVHLDSLGTEVDRIPDPHGNYGRDQAVAYLYTLEDSTGMERIDAIHSGTADRRLRSKAGP